jgi:hypothetical protein
MLSDFDPQMEYRYQTAAILYGPYSPFWIFSIVSFSWWVLEVSELITLRCTCAFLHEPQQIPRFDRCMQQASDIPSLSFACVWWMSRRWAVAGYAIKPQPCRKGCLSSMDPYRILSQLLRIRVLFVFRIFSLWCHIMIKILVGMFGRRMSASDRSQRFFDDRRGLVVEIK